MSNHKIEVKQSCIVINDYNLGDSTELEKFFKIWDPRTYTNRIFGMYYDEESKKLYVPRGLDIWFVEKCIGASAYIVRDPDPHSKMTKLPMLAFKPRNEDQDTALKFLLGKGEYTTTKYVSQLFINLATGKGKSYCSIASCCYVGSKFAVITYSTDCLKQWIGYILQYTDISEDRICFIKGSGVINRLMHLGADKYDIFLISHDTIKSYASQFGWNAVGELFKKLKIEIKIIDEAHKNFMNVTMIDFFTNTKKTFYVTATKGRSAEEENRIYQLYFKNVLSINLFNKDEDPHTIYKAIMFNSYPTPRDITACKNAYGLNRIEYMNYITNNPEFYKVLTIIIDMIIKHNSKSLIYIGINAGIQKVYDWIMNKFPVLRGNVGIYTTLIPKDRKPYELEKLIILSTTKSCGDAMDIKGLKLTVTAAEPFKSKITAIQTLGRTRDNNTVYMELVDTGFYYTKNYYYSKKSVFNKYALECQQILLTKEELETRSSAILEYYNNKTIEQPSNDLPDMLISLKE